MACRHKYETLQQTIRASVIVADTCRCIKCGAIREMRDPERPIGPHIEQTHRDEKEAGK